MKNHLLLKNRDFRLITLSDIISTFDRSVFENLVEKVIVGGITEEGTIDPAKICFVYKSGNESSFNGKQFKDRRKNASSKQASETTELCSIDRNNDKKLCTQQLDTKDRGCRQVGSQVRPSIWHVS